MKRKKKKKKVYTNMSVIVYKIDLYVYSYACFKVNRYKCNHASTYVVLVLFCSIIII